MTQRPMVCFTLPSRQPGQGDGFGVLEVEYQDVAAAFARRGWSPVVTRIGEPDFWRTVLRIGANPANLVFFGHFFYDSALTASFAPPRVPLGEALEARVAAYLGDHPFSSFMLDRVLGLPRNATVFLFEPGFATPLRLLRPEAKRLATLPGLAFGLPDAAPTPSGARPFDLLIPLRWKAGRGVSEVLEKLHHAALRRAFEAVYESACEDFGCALFECFTECLATEAGIDLAALLRDDLPTARRLMEVLTAVDFCVRDQRRRSLVRSLLADPGDSRICVIGDDVHEICPGARVTQFGPVSFAELTRAMGMARMVAHSQPTYPRALHERFLNAAASACLPLCEDAPAWREAFREGEEWIATSGRSLAEITSRLEPGRVAAMGVSARAACLARYSVDRHVARILDAIAEVPAEAAPAETHP